jgi:hypothetical protein
MPTPVTHFIRPTDLEVLRELAGLQVAVVRPAHGVVVLAGGTREWVLPMPDGDTAGFEEPLTALTVALHAGIPWRATLEPADAAAGEHGAHVLQLTAGPRTIRLAVARCCACGGAIAEITAIAGDLRDETATGTGTARPWCGSCLANPAALSDLAADLDTEARHGVTINLPTSLPPVGVIGARSDGARHPVHAQ